MRNLPHLSAMLYNAPLMLRPDTAETFSQVFNSVLAGGVVNLQAGAHLGPAAGGVLVADAVQPKPQGYAGNVPVGRFESKPYIVTDAGIGVLPVYGALMQRREINMMLCTEMASYQRISATLDAMQADPDVRGVLMEFDSPGGQVAGAFELAARIGAATKPVWAHVNEGAYSAAYLLSAAAGRIVTPDTGMVGSIGVIMMHVSQAERDTKQGYKYTAIYAGARKNDFNSHAPLSPAAKAEAQGMVDALYGRFTTHVADRRGIDEQAVRDTEAGILDASAAQSLGLIDQVATFADTLAELEAHVQGTARASVSFTSAVPAGRIAAQQPQLSRKENSMSENAQAGTQNLSAPANPAAPVDANAVAASAVAAERTRVAGILAHPEANGREVLAHTLATESGMTVEQCGRVLAAAPKAAPAAGNAFVAAMNGVPNPAVGAGGAAEAEDEAALAASIVGLVQPRKTV